MPLLRRAIASKATEICSPVETKASYSLRSGSGLISFAKSIRSSVLLPIADKTTVTLLPFWISASTLSATASMRSASATEVPPNFFTINLPIKKASILYY